MTITYEENRIVLYVKLDGRRIGHIQKAVGFYDGHGYQYATDTHKGKVFSTIAEVKRSLEGKS